jgi:hypothetical protein
MNKQFEEWFETWEKEWMQLALFDNDISFEDWPFQLQWGVYLEFFDSVGIDIDSLYLDTQLFFEENSPDWNRLEAQQEAVKKAFEILNK